MPMHYIKQHPGNHIPTTRQLLPYNLPEAIVASYIWTMAQCTTYPVHALCLHMIWPTTCTPFSVVQTAPSLISDACCSTGKHSPLTIRTFLSYCTTISYHCRKIKALIRVLGKEDIQETPAIKFSGIVDTNRRGEVIVSLVSYFKDSHSKKNACSFWAKRWIFHSNVILLVYPRCYE